MGDTVRDLGSEPSPAAMSSFEILFLLLEIQGMLLWSLVDPEKGHQSYLAKTGED
jgi:hypothetical protein